MATKLNLKPLYSAFTISTTTSKYRINKQVYGFDSITSGHYIGELYGGGVVFDIWGNGKHGLIVSRYDLGMGKDYFWGPGKSMGNGPLVDNSFNNGKINTKSIVKYYKKFNDLNYPAALCENYAITIDNIIYDDWYMPSYTELRTLMQQCTIINFVLDHDSDTKSNGLKAVSKKGYVCEGHQTIGYWSSTTHSDRNAYVSEPNYPGDPFSMKTYCRNKVRAIRSF